MKMKSLLTGVTIAALIALGVMAGLCLPADWWMTKDQQGEKLMAAEKFGEAAETFEDPMRQGVAYFRDANFESAARAFGRVDNAQASFNRGDSLIMLGKYEEAIASFDRALQFEPDWSEAQENRNLAVARLAFVNPDINDAGGTGGQLEADEIVFDDRAKNSAETQEVEVGSGEQMSDEGLRELWLQRVQTSPGDFLRVKFSYQLSRRDQETDE